jgi:hypothetical protein
MDDESSGRPVLVDGGGPETAQQLVRTAGPLVCLGSGTVPSDVADAVVVRGGDTVGWTHHNVGGPLDRLGGLLRR